MRGTVITVTGRLAPIGGIARSTLELSRCLRDLGWSVQCIYPESGDLGSEWEAFAGLTRISPLRLSARHPLQSIANLGQMRRVPHQRPTVVHTHSVPHFEFGWALARLHHAGHVIHLRSESAVVGNRLSRAVRAADECIAVSPSTRDHWARITGREDIEVVPNGIDTRKFAPSTSRTSSADDPLRIIFLGRTEAEKGLDVAVAAFKRAEPQLPTESTLTVVGASRNEKALSWAREVISSGGSSVHWLGAVSDVAAHLSDADVVVMPSRSEPFGRVAIEAMASAVPVIGSSVGGLTAVLKGVVGNMLVPAGDVEALAKALVTSAHDRPLSHETRNGLRERAESYSLSSTAVRVDEVLQRACR